MHDSRSETDDRSSERNATSRCDPPRQWATQNPATGARRGGRRRRHSILYSAIAPAPHCGQRPVDADASVPHRRHSRITVVSPAPKRSDLASSFIVIAIGSKRQTDINEYVNISRFDKGSRNAQQARRGDSETCRLPVRCAMHERDTWGNPAEQRRRADRAEEWGRERGGGGG